MKAAILTIVAVMSIGGLSSASYAAGSCQSGADVTVNQGQHDSASKTDDDSEKKVLVED